MNSEYFNEAIETMPPEQLRVIQEEKFKTQLDYAWSKSAIYQAKFKEAGLERGDTRGSGGPSQTAFYREGRIEKG